MFHYLKMSHHQDQYFNQLYHPSFTISSNNVKNKSAMFSNTFLNKTSIPLSFYWKIRLTNKNSMTWLLASCMMRILIRIYVLLTLEP